jgi:hypothetical protein
LQMDTDKLRKIITIQRWVQSSGGCGYGAGSQFGLVDSSSAGGF